MMKINLKALSAKELTEFIATLGQSPYRARQLNNWIYKKHATSFDEMTDMSKSFRELLEKTAFISNMKLIRKQISKDGTQKFLLALEDGETIESVLIPDKNRLTLCISSQVGCAAGCKFCMTGSLGLKRNLKAHEIVDQIIAVQRLIEQRQIIPPHPCLPDRQAPLIKGGRGDYAITNIVFMGMGEPLLNFTEVIEALWRIINFIGFSKKRITLSTVGIIPKIFELADKGPQISLAVSLNATTDTVRNKIMPINRKYPIKKLIKTCREFPLAPGRKITFEYVLIDGVNDSKDDALRLVKLLKGIKSKVNLIQYNPCSKKAEFRNPSEDTISVFQKILLNSGMTVIIRKSRGEDISAACGQLGYKNDTQRRETLCLHC